MKLTILSYARTWDGSDDYALIKSFKRLGHSIFTLDDEKYVLPKWNNKLLKIIRRLLRPLLVNNLNMEFIGLVDKIKPDFVFVFKGTFITKETIKYIKNKNIPIILYFPDISFFAHGPYLKESIDKYDYIFTSKSFAVTDLINKFPYLNGKISFEPLYYDPSLHLNTCEPISHPKYECDVSFIANWSYKKESYLKYLIDRMPTDIVIKIWGDGWKKGVSEKMDKCIQYSGIYGDEYIKALNSSKINLCILQENQKGGVNGDLITARTFQIPPTKSFFLHEYSNELRNYFSQDEVPSFTSRDDLYEKVIYFLDNDQLRLDAIEKAYSRVIRSGYSSDDKANKIINIFHEIKK
ncbi:TPA: CgeB family protein [Photobacterium damselae]